MPYREVTFWIAILAVGISIISILYTRKSTNLQEKNVTTSGEKIASDLRKEGRDILIKHSALTTLLFHSRKGHKVSWNEGLLGNFLDDIENWVVNVNRKLVTIDDAYEVFDVYFQNLFEEEGILAFLEKKQKVDPRIYENIWWLEEQFKKKREE